MKELYAVYLESLDQDLRVYLDKDEAKARYDELVAQDKPVKVQKFSDYQIVSFVKENGAPASSPDFWEEIIYDNGTCKLVETFRWHKDPDPEGYYADYLMRWF